MSPRLAGRATLEETRRRCAERGGEAASGARALFGMTRWSVSGAGFGGYRIHDADSTHYEALVRALRHGVNLIDTSANYGDGASERLVGRALRELTAAGEITRGQIIVVTKGGYMQGCALMTAREREAEGRPFPETVKVAESCWHCIHPEFLADQIRRSLDRLELDAIDAYLLHNPEYFLRTAARHNMPLDETRQMLYERIERAFAFLETEVAAGRIGVYGVSSNSFPLPAGDFLHVSLEQCWNIAERLSEAHHFRVAQFPANLFETGAWTERNQAAGTQSAMEFAAAHNIGVLLNRPLNAIADNRLIRLADPPPDLSRLATRFHHRLQALKHAEMEIKTLAEKKRAPIQTIDIAACMEERFPDFAGADSWETFLQAELAPLAHMALKEIDRVFSKSHARDELKSRFLAAAQDAFQAAEQYVEAANRPYLEFVHEALDPALPDALRRAPLSQKAIWILRTLPGAPIVLVGMREPEYVNDVLAALAMPPSPIPFDGMPNLLETSWVAGLE